MSDAIFTELVNRLRSLTGQPIPKAVSGFEEADSAALLSVDANAATALTSSLPTSNVTGAAAPTATTQPIPPRHS